MRKQSTFCAAAILVMLAFNLHSIQAETIKFGANESPPYWSENDPHSGMCGEILHLLSQIVGIEANIVFEPLQRLINDKNNNDLGDPSFYIKNQDFAVIIPIALQHSSFHYYLPNQKSAIRIENWEGLKDYKVGILKGTFTQISYFNQLDIHFEESYSQISLLKKLKLGRIDMAIDLDLVINHNINQLFPEEKSNFQSIPIRNSTTPIAMMIATHHPGARQLGEKYRAALLKIIQDGSYQKILEKYYGKGNMPDNWFADLERFGRLYRFIQTE